LEFPFGFSIRAGKRLKAVSSPTGTLAAVGNGSTVPVVATALVTCLHSAVGAAHEAGLLRTRKKGNFMFRSLLIAASLTALVLSLGGGSIALASEAQPALNIGFVLYSKGNVPGTLNARWTYQNMYSGKGLATGGPKEGFAGHYHIRYYDEQGKFSDEYDLVIEKAGAFYNASWITNGKVSAGGVGMEVKNGLAIGWRRVAD
jgi:hypothetical protein